MLTTPGKTQACKSSLSNQNPPRKPTFILLLTASILAPTVRLHAQGHPPPAATESPAAYEPLPTLDASVILQPQFFQGPNFYGTECRADLLRLEPLHDRTRFILAKQASWLSCWRSFLICCCCARP